MRHYDSTKLSVREVNALLLGGVAPRPIALVSTVSEKGVVNLSPFSFFNVFGANPPTVAFSASTRGRDGTRKDTYYNLVATKECVIQAVTFDMVEQISLASAEYPSEVDEFVKAGLTPVASDTVRPPRVAESPFQMECKLDQMIPLGDGPGAGNLAICQVLRFHVADDLYVDDLIHPDRIDLVGRNGGNWYARASGSALFEVAKPVEKRGVGFDNLPQHILSSQVLTANDLGKLANCDCLPTDDEITAFISEMKKHATTEMDKGAFERARRRNDYQQMLLATLAAHPESARTRLELTAKAALVRGDVAFAWRTLLTIPRMI